MIYGAYVLLFIGGLSCIVGAVIAVSVAIEMFLDWRREPHRRSYLEGMSDAKNRLANDAWWFSESPETMQLLQDLARGVGVSEARERWRKARAKQEQEA